MPAIISSIIPGSPAAQTIIQPQDVLLKINNEDINDILDYRFHSADTRLVLELADQDDKLKYVTINNPEDSDLGLEFDSFLLDKQRSCENNCIFCFIDQLPKGMRESLYIKDDDVRLSFLQGNYITLTNLSRKDVRRIIKQRISPINISVHTLEPSLRKLMLRNKQAATSIGKLFDLAKAGIKLNCQIVCCPGINDGAMLNRTLKKLLMLTPAINSVSVVPVGLTKHRDNLTFLTEFDNELAEKTIHQVHRFARKSFREKGERVFYCSDELYMLAGLRLPSNGFYEDYPQLENGVGMMRLFITEFLDQLQKTNFSEINPIVPFSIATGTLASKYLISLLNSLRKCYDNVPGFVYPIVNEFFGESITVSGLLTGNDVARQLSGKNLGSRLFIPQNMLRSGENVFLDDMTVDELSNRLGVPVRIVKQNGADLFNAIFE